MIGKEGIIVTIRALILAALAALAVAGCGDDDGGGLPPDAGGLDAMQPVDAGMDGDGGSQVTFAEFVIDLIQNQTSDEVEPVPVDFSLPDTEDPDAFDVLFQ